MLTFIFQKIKTPAQFLSSFSNSLITINYSSNTVTSKNKQKIHKIKITDTAAFAPP